MHRRCGGGGGGGGRAREWGESRRGARGEGDPSVPELHRTAASKLGNARACCMAADAVFRQCTLHISCIPRPLRIVRPSPQPSLLPTAPTGTPVRRDTVPRPAFHFSQIITYKSVAVSAVCLVFQKCAVLKSDCGFRMMLGPLSLHLPGVSHNFTYVYSTSHP